MERNTEAQRKLADQLNDSKRVLVVTLNEFLVSGSLIARDGIDDRGVHRIDRAWREFYDNLFTYIQAYGDSSTIQAVDDMRPTQWEIVEDGATRPYIPGDLDE